MAILAKTCAKNCKVINPESDFEYANKDTIGTAIIRAIIRGAIMGALFGTAINGILNEDLGEGASLGGLAGACINLTRFLVCAWWTSLQKNSTDQP